MSIKTADSGQLFAAVLTARSSSVYFVVVSQRARRREDLPADTAREVLGDRGGGVK